jgi:arylsulfatase
MRFYPEFLELPVAAGSACVDIGSDTRTPVDDNDYKVPFRFTGKIDKVTFKLGPEQLAEQDQKAKQQAIANANN